MMERTWMVVMALALPATAVAAPDVVGIKVGVATVTEVRQVLSEQPRKLWIGEHKSELRGRSSKAHQTSESAKKDAPGADDDKYISSIKAVTEAFRDRAPDCNVSNIGVFGKGDCETITVEFSGPPGEGIALAVRRTILFATAPSLEKTEHALVEKYGPPGYQPPSRNPAQREYYWAWDASGKPVPLNAQHPCATPGASVLALDLHQREENTKTALRAACGAVVYATLAVADGAVKYVRLQAIDQAQTLGAIQKTRDFVAGAIGDEKQAERDKAGEAAAPQF